MVAALLQRHHSMDGRTLAALGVCLHAQPHTQTKSWFEGLGHVRERFTLFSAPPTYGTFAGDDYVGIQANKCTGLSSVKRILH